MKVVRAQVLTCSKCMAEYTEPLPEGYTYTVSTRLKGHLQTLYVHTEDCPRRFRPKVVLPDE